MSTESDGLELVSRVELRIMSAYRLLTYLYVLGIPVRGKGDWRKVLFDYVMRLEK